MSENSAVTLNAAQTKFLKGLAKERQEAILTLDAESQVRTIESLMLRLANSDKAVDLEFDVAAAEKRHHMLSPGIDLIAGDKVFFEFYGTLIKTTTKPEAAEWNGWEEVEEPVALRDERGNLTGETKKVKYWYNRTFLGKNVQTGEEIGFYNNSIMAKMLTKIPTIIPIDGKPGAAKNPIIEVEYVGKVEGREELAKYGIVPRKGSTAHVYLCRPEKGVRYNPYEEGCVNLLQFSLPNLTEKKQLSFSEKMMRDFDRQQAVVGVDAAAALPEGRPALSEGSVAH